jgi:hypothetical protein
LIYNSTTSRCIALGPSPFDLPALVGPVASPVAQSTDAPPRMRPSLEGGASNLIPNRLYLVIRIVETIDTWVTRFQCSINIVANTRKCIKPKLNVPALFHTLPVANRGRRAFESMVCVIAVLCTNIGNSNQDTIGNPVVVVGSMTGLSCN